MWRKAQNYMQTWYHRPTRKPLVIRGARQVGKSTLVELTAEALGVQLITINMEKPGSLYFDFDAKDPTQLLESIRFERNVDLSPENCLIFFDEVQAKPEIMHLLRYFYEDVPAYAIVVAGSLLEFELASPDFSMPVGRAEFLYLGPMDFEEFLLACDQEILYSYMLDYELKDTFNETAHNKLIDQLKNYLLTGGMPEAIKTWAQTEDLHEVFRIKSSILDTYTLDFNKYKAKINVAHLSKLFKTLPGLIGKKLKYSMVDSEIKSALLAKSMQQLAYAKVAYSVYHSHANGVPLGAEKSAKIFKPLFLDVGLVLSVLGLSPSIIKGSRELNLINNGHLTEQFIGQHLLYAQAMYIEPELYYWVREQPSSNAEVDYLFALAGEILPIEVKAGKTGSLKSLHQYVLAKACRRALRFDSKPPSVTRIRHNAPNGAVRFQLISLPHYLVGQTARLLGSGGE